MSQTSTRSRPACTTGRRRWKESSAPTRKVWMIVRGRDLADSMSRYLVDRIAGQPNIEVVTQANITALEGRDGVLETIRWRNKAGVETQRPIGHLFLLIGAAPNTKWLPASRGATQPKGFHLTRAG